MYRIEAARSRVKRELKRIAEADRVRIVDEITALRMQPRPDGVVQLAPNVYRIRVGDYRVIDKVFDEQELILIGRITRRDEGTYRGIGSLFD